MKKTLLKILILCFTICSTFCVLTACGESPISFKLNFIVDNEIVKTIDTTGNEKIALPTDPEKEGFSFDGWFWDNGTWERPFTANSLLDAPLSSDMSVYAKFTKNHEHDYIATITAPTCTEKGYITYTCDCGASYVDNYVDELGHEYNAIITEPTCTEQGYTTHTCSRCRDSYIDTYTDALGHEFTNYVYDNNATYSEDGTKTAVCNRGCGATDTVTAENTKLKSGIEFKTLAVDGNNGYGKIPNAQTEFDFLTEIEKKGNVTYEVSRNLSGDDIIVSKTAEPNVGNNKYYILVYQNGELLSRYNITIRRREIYGVFFNSVGGSTVEPQYIEEDDFATEPITAKAGYTFIEWDYDFTNPITRDLTINASWTANTNTPYKVEYYLQNLEDDNYTLYETENLTGTTDTTAIAEIKEYEHFTHTTISESNESENINGDGTTVLKVYYTRNEYTIRLVAGDNVIVDNPYDGKFKYGYLIEEISATTKVGYDWQGWYNPDDEFITKNLSFVVEEDVNYVAKATLKEEMSNFIFNSTENTCNITGIKNKSLKEIIISDSVTSISAGAFRGCSSLESITIPFVGDRIKTASDSYRYPFGYIFGTSSYTGGTATQQHYYINSTSSITKTYYIPSSLKSVTVTGGNILYGAFDNCSGLTSITIPDSVTSIGEKAFYGCSGLTSIVIPDRVTSIGLHAFANCYKLVEVINKSMLNITKGSTDYGDVGLNALTVHNGESKIVNKDGYLFITESDKNHLLGYIGTDTELILPNDYNGASYNIYKYAFFYCSSLTNITIPNSVISIGEYAFYGCSSLQYNEYGNALYLGNETNKYLVLVKAKSADIATCSINSNTRFIMNFAFSGCSSLTNITIPNSVTSIGHQAFYNCRNLTSITIPNSVTSIEDYAFSYCSSLTNITIPNSVTSIRGGAFAGCSSLTNITIPDSVTSIGQGAFYNCSNLTNINFNDTTTWYRTGDYTKWRNKTGGKQTDVTNASTNAAYFTSTYYDNYWYKL